MTEFIAYLKHTKSIKALASLPFWLNGIQEVSGSIPLISTKGVINKPFFYKGGFAEIVWL